MTLKGRYWTLLWLLLFLGAAVTVSGRQREALATARRLDRLREERRSLEAQAADLEQRIRTATARGVLDVKVERTLGLTLPTSRNSATLTLPATPPPGR